MIPEGAMNMAGQPIHRVIPDRRPWWRRLSLRHPIRVWRRAPMDVWDLDAEVIVYDRLLSDEERATVEACLREKWAR